MNRVRRHATARSEARWPRPPAELIRFVRALAVDDARRDHDAALDATRKPEPETDALPMNATPGHR